MSDALEMARLLDRLQEQREELQRMTLECDAIKNAIRDLCKRLDPSSAAVRRARELGVRL